LTFEKSRQKKSGKRLSNKELGKPRGRGRRRQRAQFGNEGRDEAGGKTKRKGDQQERLKGREKLGEETHDKTEKKKSGCVGKKRRIIGKNERRPGAQE